jgi:membrane-bound serine protease (ClpP class)
MRQHMGKIVTIAIVIGALLLLFSPLVSGANGKIYSLTIDGAISPATADYFIRGLDKAIDDDADLLILNLNTPGGLDKSMRDMIQAILDSPIPVVSYVSPKGSRAASAGTYLVYASHIAAMAPATNLGSATPVSIGFKNPVKPQNKSGDEEDQQEQPPLETMERKIVNDAKAYIRSLAQLRGRNEAWAEEAVNVAANLSAEEALTKKVIDIIAYNEAKLIEQLHNRTLAINEKSMTLVLEDPEVIYLQTDWRTDLLMIITDPSIAYLLLLAGIYGLMFEFLHPGSLLPGTIGAICLLMAMYAFNLLPINLAGLALLILGLLLMVAEAFAPSFGILGIGGIAAFIIGSFMLMDGQTPGYQIAPSLIISAAIVSGVIGIVVVSMVLKVQRRPIVSGVHELLNNHATALEDFDGAGRVMIRGEVWQADSVEPISKSQRVKVVAVDGLRLKVSKED